MSGGIYKTCRCGSCGRGSVVGWANVWTRGLRGLFQPYSSIFTYLQRGKDTEQPKPVRNFHALSKKSSTPRSQLHLTDFQSQLSLSDLVTPSVIPSFRGQTTALPCSRQEVEPCTKSQPRINASKGFELFSFPLQPGWSHGSIQSQLMFTSSDKSSRKR